MPGPTFWGLYLVSGIVLVFCASRGGSRGGVRLRTPRYYGPLGCLPKRAGRPMGPATLL